MVKKIINSFYQQLKKIPLFTVTSEKKDQIKELEWKNKILSVQYRIADAANSSKDLNRSLYRAKSILHMEIKKIGIHVIAKMPFRLDNNFIPGIHQKLFLFVDVGLPNTVSLLDVLNNGNKPLFNEGSKMLDNKVIFDTHSTNAYETKRTGDGKFVVVSSSITTPFVVLGNPHLQER